MCSQVFLICHGAYRDISRCVEFGIVFNHIIKNRGLWPTGFFLYFKHDECRSKALINLNRTISATKMMVGGQRHQSCVINRPAYRKMIERLKRIFLYSHDLMHRIVEEASNPSGP